MALARGKIITLKEAGGLARQYHSAGQRLVLTNGHFDLLHVGHALYLEQARQMGDVLFVGVNSDASTATLKGANRPIVPASERALLLTCLRSVDYAIVFEGETAVELVKAIRPDFYVKGGDYTLDSLPEAKAAIEIGATVRFVPLSPGRSTSLLIDRILSLHHK